MHKADGDVKYVLNIVFIWAHSCDHSVWDEEQKCLYNECRTLSVISWYIRRGRSVSVTKQQQQCTTRALWCFYISQVPVSRRGWTILARLHVRASRIMNSFCAATTSYDDRDCMNMLVRLLLSLPAPYWTVVSPLQQPTHARIGYSPGWHHHLIESDVKNWICSSLSLIEEKSMNDISEISCELTTIDAKHCACVRISPLLNRICDPNSLQVGL